MTVATVVAVSGKVWIKGTDGQLRVAHEGDALAAGEMLITAEGASVSMGFSDGRPPAMIGESTQVALVTQIGEGDISTDLALESTDVASIIDLIENTDGDLLDALEAPAGNQAGVAPDDEGNYLVRLLRIVEDVDPLFYQFSQSPREDTLVRDDERHGEDEPNQSVSLSGLGDLELGDASGSLGHPDSPSDESHTASFSGVERVVEEAGLADGSASNRNLVARSGNFGFSAPDGLQSMVVGNSSPLEVAHLQRLSFSPITLEMPSGILFLTGFSGDETGGSISYTYMLSENIDGDSTPGARDEGMLESIDISVTDVDGSTANGSLEIAILDDAPSAIDDAVSTGEDTSVTYNVLTNRHGSSDIQGADGAHLDMEANPPTLADPRQGTINALDENGNITFTPAAGIEGEVIIHYTIIDADGDTSRATLTVTVAPDSAPGIVVSPPGHLESSEENSSDYTGTLSDPADDTELPAGNGLHVVDEGGLADDSNAETVTGTFDIAMGGDDPASLVINGTDVTGGGMLATEFGTMVVTRSDGGYSWSYTLDRGHEHKAPGGGVSAGADARAGPGYLQPGDHRQRRRHSRDPSEH